jgi:hypothetical protein
MKDRYNTENDDLPRQAPRRKWQSRRTALAGYSSGTSLNEAFELISTWRQREA